MKNEEKLILFDIDGTLINTHGSGLRALKNSLKEVFGRSFDDIEVSAYGKTDQYIINEFIKKSGAEYKKKCTEEVLNIYPKKLKKELKKSKTEFLLGVPDILYNLLEEKNIYLGISTGNIKKGAYVKLKHFGIDKLFIDGGFGDGFNDRIPIVRQAIKKIEKKVSKKFNKVLVVGDTPYDILSAKKNKCLSVGVATGKDSMYILKKYKPDILCSRLSSKYIFNKIKNI